MVFFDLLITYQTLCPTDHFFGQRHMSQNTSPTWIVLLESIYRIIQVFFLHFPHVLDSITIRFTMFGATQKIKTNGERKNVQSICLILKPKYVEDMTLYLSD